ncbi:MAG: hypothetical protein U9O49_03190 [Candidatus Thermoplasmatota archaeon]|nr:hypothetical protein [Candidatus Thermoplasmatota archaeon]
MDSTIIAALATLGAIMVLGFIGNYFFNRTQIPSIVYTFGVTIISHYEKKKITERQED